MAGAFLISLEGGYSYLTHSPTYFADGTQRKESFGQSRADATLFAEYRPSDSIGINTTLRYDGSLGNERIPLDNTATAQDNLQYNRYELWVGARWFM